MTSSAVPWAWRVRWGRRAPLPVRLGSLLLVKLCGTLQGVCRGTFRGTQPSGGLYHACVPAASVFGRFTPRSISFHFAKQDPVLSLRLGSRPSRFWPHGEMNSHRSDRLSPHSLLMRLAVPSTRLERSHHDGVSPPICRFVARSCAQRQRGRHCTCCARCCRVELLLRG